MESNSPPPCSNTVTVRRNPPRRAKATPSSAVPLSLPPSSKKSTIRSFPIQDILSINIPQIQNPYPNQDISSISDSLPPDDPTGSDNLKVFLRIRPNVTQEKAVKNLGQKNVWPKNPSRKKDVKVGKGLGKKKSEVCLKVNDQHSVTLCPPQSLQDVRRTKTEVYEGFSHVFCAESSQSDVYERMVTPLVEDFLNGKSGMLAALGPSGSGKTHTVFGSAREPGMVSLALRQIFSTKESNGSKCSRTFYLSMFEIYSERGKGEKIMDLSQEGGDLYMQQSIIRGLQEAVIHDVQEAESLIATGMLKRSTATTNSNFQSSRSQCIINIRSGLDNIDEDTDAQSCTALLTIVDLAGAEREKRTGNQGARLLESNFINNTSMVFGLCLRSLLEHQRNPKKPFHKHFQNSLLTKYLRDFLEGKKRMTLILTAKSGEEDYHDTSYLLRQASPYMNIKFENVEEQPTNAFGNKKRTHTLPKAEQHKKMKFSSNEVCVDGDAKGDILHQLHKEGLTPEQVRDRETKGSSVKCPVIIDVDANENKSVNANISDFARRARENQILLNFSRALWNVLKEYKNKLEATEKRCLAMEKELKKMKASSSYGKEAVHEVNTQVSSLHPVELECFKHISDDTVTCSVALFPECFGTVNTENPIPKGMRSTEAISTTVGVDNFNEQSSEKVGISCTYVVFDKEDLKELQDSNINREIAELHRDEIASYVEGDRSQHEEGRSLVEVVSTSVNLEKFEEQSNESTDVSSANVLFDKENFKELEQRDTSGEIAGCDTFESAAQGSESPPVLGDGISSSLEEDQPKHEEEINLRIPSSNLEGLMCIENKQFSDSTDIPDPQEDVSSSQGCNANKLSEPEASVVEPCQSFNAAKPKRRLQPVSSVLLRNINSLGFDDASEIPKGRRGEKKVDDVSTKRTQGSISLVRLLKENVHR